jgi:signal transduction histidine kinase/ligand-binding sensor domain-containing protein/CheY-like chemotaxis protein
MLRLRTIGAFAWLIMLPDVLHAQRYSFKRYDQDSGLLNQNVRTLLQDRTGFLWVGTDNGLFRYDGSRFRGFNTADGLPASQIEDLNQTADGTLWVATLSGVARLDGDRFKAVDISPGRGSVAIASDARGHLYVGIYAGLLARRWEADALPGAASRLYAAPDQASQGVRSIAVDPSGSVWYGCARQLCRLDGESVVHRPEWDVPDDLWDAVRIDPEGNVWARSRTKLIELPKGETRFLRRDIDLPAAEDGQLLISKSGQLWVPTLRGLARQTAAGWDIVGKSRGLPISSVKCALEDREGSIWIGLNGGGLVRWLGSPQWESWTEAEGLSSESVWAVQRDRGGVLWTASNTGVSRFNEARSRWEELKASGLLPVTTTALMPSPDGSLWVGQTTGVLRVDLRRGVATAYRKESGLENPWVTSLALDPQNRVWVGTPRGLYRNVSAGGVRFERQELPLETGPDFIFTVLVDRRGRIWVGSRNGLLRLEAGRWIRLTTGDGLLHNLVRRLAEGTEGSVWVSYAEPVGVSQLVSGGDHPRLRHFSRKEGLNLGQIFFIGCDLRGRIWCGTDQGVDVYDGMSWRHFDHTDGLTWDDCSANAFWADPDGSIWMGTTRGITRLRSSGDKLPARPTAAPVLLTSAALGEQTISLDHGASVPWWQRSLQVGFTALTFVNEDNIRFRYRLAGLEDRWTETRSRQAFIPSLPAGGYTFEVQANASRGEWNGTPARLFFVVRPAWWRTWWFDLIALATAGLLAHQVWAWRLRNILRRQKELEDAVADRTHSLELEKAHAERERDIVEKQKLEIERLFQESRQAARLKDEFLANMSHEFRTPMNAVIGMTELALGTAVTPEQKEYLEEVRSSSGTLLGILDDILEVSQLEAGKFKLQAVAFDLDEVLEGVFQKMSLRAHQKHLVLKLQAHANVPRGLFGDARSLCHVLLNLVSNAVKFTERGQVSVHVDLEEETERPLLHFEVRDTGIGILPEKQAVIFEPFSQADGKHTRRYGGTGLGLTICARFVEMMAGRIWVESEPGKGSRFHFSVRFQLAPQAAQSKVSLRDLTAASLTAQAATVESKPSAATESPERVSSLSSPSSFTPLDILLAEDNPVNQKLAVRLLQKRGHRVVTASDGKQAVAAFARQSFDAVLMDVQMPEMDGLEATIEIRERERHTGKRIPIIALTAHTTAADRERCLEAGMDDYIPKPIEPAKLFAAIERWKRHGHDLGVSQLPPGAPSQG